MTILAPEIVLALLLATPHDCGGIDLPPPRYDVLLPIAELPVVKITDSYWDVDGICLDLGVQRATLKRFNACTSGAAFTVIMPPMNDQFTDAEWQCLLYHEVRGHFGGHWPADHPGAVSA